MNESKKKTTLKLRSSNNGYLVCKALKYVFDKKKVLSVSQNDIYKLITVLTDIGRECATVLKNQQKETVSVDRKLKSFLLANSIKGIARVARVKGVDSPALTKGEYIHVMNTVVSALKNALDMIEEFEEMNENEKTLIDSDKKENENVPEEIISTRKGNDLIDLLSRKIGKK